MAQKESMLSNLDEAFKKRQNLVLENVFAMYNAWTAEVEELQAKIEALSDDSSPEFEDLKAAVDKFAKQQVTFQIGTIEDDLCNRSVTSDYVSPTKSEILSDFRPPVASTPIKESKKRTPKRRLLPPDADSTPTSKPSTIRSRKSPKISPIKPEPKHEENENLVTQEDKFQDSAIDLSMSTVLKTSSSMNTTESVAKQIMKNLRKRLDNRQQQQQEKFTCSICKKSLQERNKCQHYEKCILKNNKNPVREYYCKYDGCGYTLPRCELGDIVIKYHLKLKHEIYEDLECHYAERKTGLLAQPLISAFFNKK